MSSQSMVPFIVPFSGRGRRLRESEYEDTQSSVPCSDLHGDSLPAAQPSPPQQSPGSPAAGTPDSGDLRKRVSACLDVAASWQVLLAQAGDAELAGSIDDYCCLLCQRATSTSLHEGTVEGLEIMFEKWKKLVQEATATTAKSEACCDDEAVQVEQGAGAPKSTSHNADDVQGDADDDDEQMLVADASEFDFDNAECDRFLGLCVEDLPSIALEDSLPSDTKHKKKHEIVVDDDSDDQPIQPAKKAKASSSKARAKATDRKRRVAQKTKPKTGT